MRSIRPSLFALVLLALALPAGTALAQDGTTGPSSVEATSSLEGFDLAAMDRSADPCKDFFRFADGGWVSTHPIPPEYPSWGRFQELRERNQELLRGILEQSAADDKAPRGSNVQKIGDFYASCMDTAQVEEAGLDPLADELGRIAAIHDQETLQAEIAHLQSAGVDALFRLRSAPDRKDSTRVIANAFQGGLGLPDRDYYVKDDEKSKTILAQYQQHVAKMLGLAGDAAPDAAREAADVVALETRLARASMTRVERRDPVATYHKMEVADLATSASTFSWPRYFASVGHPEIAALNVAQPDFFRAADQALADVPLATWKTYLRWHLLDAFAAALPARFVDEDFEFNQHTLQGSEKILPRWKRCVNATDDDLGEALGAIYVAQNFPAAAKARAKTMVDNLIAALRDDLETLPWMSEETRRAAIAKLDAFTPKIGYPDKWRDYTAYDVDRGPYAGNALRGERFAFADDLAKIGKPVDRSEWGMTPPIVNAYYNPSRNEIVFPAGILQPPFYDPDGDDAANYGGIGAVIGHEMTHGFDDQGRKFDADGNLTDWWTAADAERYQQRAQCVEQQFSKYEVQPGLFENGKLVLGESIADLGGLRIAQRAYEKSREGSEPEPDIDGLTPEQRLFVAWAQIWAANDRPEFERLMVQVNPHPLARFRAIGAPSNLPGFAAVFSCPAASPMVRPADARCAIW